MTAIDTEGIAPETRFSASPSEENNLRISTLPLAAPQQRDPGTDRHELASVDPRLARLCAAWASLPEHVVLAILALVDAAGVVEVVRLQPSSREPQGLR